ncbi:hypothetical protein [Pseudofrankia sp. BMG5.37]|nr:hypothetical protein [Pseudofrankia sp. BMG5.37]MDT3440179.1 hypothetical protein [Pseudofrankia sp. BMG5.37]
MTSCAGAARIWPGPVAAASNRKGVFTRDRRPKAAAFALRRRWRGAT